ncbi:MAG: S-layer homology domain-containing protein [Clostridiales bacterium]|nr:S-layer homology domain-containing protein [Clostridiales bacterium]
MKKRFLSLFISFALLASIMVTASFATDMDSSRDDSVQLVASDGSVISIDSAEYDELVSISTTSAADTMLPFEDVAEDDWYYSYVVHAYQAGIVYGTGESTFSPNETLTREMFITMLGRLYSIDASIYEDTTTDFTDVSVGEWYSPYIAWAVQANIVKGLDEDTFGLGEAVSREQMATFIARYIDNVGGKLELVENPVAAFQDVDSVSDWAMEGLELVRVSGIIQGDENGNFNPQMSATRAEAAAVIIRLRDNLPDDVPADTKNFNLISLENVSSVEIKSLAGEEATSYIISTDCEDLLAYINAASVLSFESVPGTTGWIYWISFYGSDGNYLTGYRFETNWIEVNTVRYYVEEDYFLPLINPLLES